MSDGITKKEGFIITLITIPTCVFSNLVTLGTSLEMGIVMPSYMGLVRVNMTIHIKHQHR